MIVENSFKISLNKSSLIWKILVYQVITLIFVCGICIACFYPLFDHLFEHEYFSKVGTFFTANIYNFNLGSVMSQIGDLIIEIWSIISADTGLLLMAIFCVVTFVVLFTFASAMMEIPVCEVIYGYMGSYTKLNFTGSFISNLWRSLKFGLCKLVTSTIFDLIIFAGLIFGILQFGHSNILDIILPFILIFGLILFVSLKQSLFALWLPNLVTNNQKIWKSFAQSVKLSFKNFKTVFSIAIILMLIFFAVNFGLGVLTCGVGLLFSVPASILYFIVTSTVMFFHFSGLKYYVDKDKIITTKKLEDMEKLKNLEKII